MRTNLGHPPMAIIRIAWRLGRDNRPKNYFRKTNNANDVAVLISILIAVALGSLILFKLLCTICDALAPALGACTITNHHHRAIGSLRSRSEFL